MGYRPRMAPDGPRQEHYAPYDSALLDRLYDGSPAALCPRCGLDDAPLVSDRCVWCAEADNVRWHRWQQAALMRRGLAWMEQHDALPRRGYAVRALPTPPRGPAAGMPVPWLPSPARRPEWR